MEAADALQILGAQTATTWEDVRSAYRGQLMAHHPDTGGDSSSGSRTEEIVEAFRVLRMLTADGTRPFRFGELVGETDTVSKGGTGAGPGSVVDAGSAVEPGGQSPIVLHARPGDVFVQMLRAAEEIGHVSYIDRDANLLMVLIGDSDVELGWAPAQLSIELAAEGTSTTALFNLEPIGTGEAPPIGEVVNRLAQQLRAAY